jgi:hypothetical protein
MPPLPSIAVTWWALPLAAVVSLVWNASRYEQTSCILSRSARMFGWLVFWMILIGGILYGLSYNL